MNKIPLQPIGVIHTPYQTDGEAPRQAANSRDVGEVVLRPELAEGLEGIEAFPYIILIFAFHLAPAPEKLKVISWRDGVERGVFATRSPHRPNPLGISIVKLLRREGSRLFVEGVDMLDGTPLLDIKPYYSDLDCVEKRI
ncbi:MAG TPA: tRNA (N6-threonylcarbamoyladenosine(37)-N6)-methyltransferase TrmO [Anaerolineaceae bacterium]|nr:tRNA (N6-threonylcarbamoyladenosine(37)-N6)-methyltransferase TrmO [Anaerolineaceae bacterium]HPS32027.1 tRNA (N6-threonylcarbamoyladenosine(37)-N6)-methyltransferase TrmO [Anaerolineaceae bacterium]